MQNNTLWDITVNGPFFPQQLHAREELIENQYIKYGAASGL